MRHNTFIADQTQLAGASVSKRLAALFPASFKAADGYHAHHAGTDLLVCPVPRRGPDIVDLQLRFVPSRWDGGPRAPVPEANAKAASALRHDLRHPEAQTRAAACQGLGQCGDGSAMTELFILAAEDPDPFVQQTARQAIERIDLPGIELQAFRGVELILRYSGAGGVSSAIETLVTNDEGAGCFQAVPMGSACVLELANSSDQIDVTAAVAELGGLLEGLGFADDEPACRRGGLSSISVNSYRTGDPARFSALLRLRSGVNVLDDRRLPGLAVCRGSEFWPPSVACSSSGLFWFHKLPCGRFITRLSDDWPVHASRPSVMYGATGPVSPIATAAFDQPKFQIIHPPDPRLVAIVEPDRKGCTVLTIESDAPELEHARIRYVLGPDQGELGLARSRGGAAWQASLRLDQLYRGDEATRLALQVAPYSLL